MSLAPLRGISRELRASSGVVRALRIPAREEEELVSITVIHRPPETPDVGEEKKQERL